MQPAALGKTRDVTQRLQLQLRTCRAEEGTFQGEILLSRQTSQLDSRYQSRNLEDLENLDNLERNS